MANTINYIKAYVFHSTKAAFKLAQQNPNSQGVKSLAINLLNAKNNKIQMKLEGNFLYYRNTCKQVYFAGAFNESNPEFYQYTCNLHDPSLTKRKNHVQKKERVVSFLNKLGENAESSYSKLTKEDIADFNNDLRKLLQDQGKSKKDVATFSEKAKEIFETSYKGNSLIEKDLPPSYSPPPLYSKANYSKSS